MAQGRTRKYWREMGAYLFVVLMASIGFYALGQQDDDIIAGQVASCESNNDVREGQRQVWDFFFTVSKASAKAQDQPQEVIDFYDEYLRWINEEALPNRDCEDLTKVYPPPGPPPSFEKALAEAQLQERIRDRQQK